MPRVARKKSESGIYHIVLRGINKQIIFFDDEDKKVFLNRLKLIKDKADFDIYAFCFMDNHVHLLVREKNVSISEIMRKCLTSYVYWYNCKYERIGNLFQDRFNSEPIETDEYLLCAVRYIHQNPVKAGIVESPSQYAWSSYSSYLNENEDIVSKNLLLDLLQGKEQYKAFMEKTEDGNFIEPSEFYRITDEKLIKEILNKLNIKAIKEIQNYSKKEIYNIVKKINEIKGSNLYQISRVTGIPFGMIRQILE